MMCYSVTCWEPCQTPSTLSVQREGAALPGRYRVMATSAASAPVVRRGHKIAVGSGPWTHQGEPLALALHRLAHKAHEEGLEILPEPWAPFASRVSSSRPG